jgi:aromatic amino acid aminotransferase I
MSTKPLAKDLRHHLSDEAKSRQPSQLKVAFKHFHDPKIISLGGGLPLPELFPFNSIEVDSLAAPFKRGINVQPESDDELLKIKIAKHPDESSDIPLSISLQYGNSAGAPELVNFIKKHTEIIHNPPYQDWEIILTVGNTHAWDSTIRTFTNRGDTILAEKYTFSSASECARSNGLNIAPVEVDLEGIIPEELEKQLANWVGPLPKLLYTIPTGQNPTGGTLSTERRQAIYKIAQKYDFIIVEDEPYYFLQMDKYTSDKSARTSENITYDTFPSSLVKSYLSLDTDGRVIRLDSYSKVLAPGSRLGWIVTQSSLAERYLRQHEVTIQVASGFAQSIVNGLLQRWGQEGYIDWLIELRKSYTQKRNSALDAVEQYVPKEVADWIPPTAGMFFWIKVDGSKHPEFATKYASDPSALETAIYEHGIKDGVLMIPGHWFLIQDKETSSPSTDLFFRGTFASVSEDKLQKGLKIFGDVIKAEFGL